MTSPYAPLPPLTPAPSGTRATPPTASPAGNGRCIHHWLTKPPEHVKGDFLPAHCLKCKARREFPKNPALLRFGSIDSIRVEPWARAELEGALCG